MNKFTCIAWGLGLAVFFSGPAAGAEWFGGLFGKDAAKSDRDWSEGRYDYMKVQPAEPGAANAQPVSVSAERLRLLLASVQFKNKSGEAVPLFAEAEAERLAGPLSAALRRADAHQDVIFFSSEPRGEGLLAPRLAVAGRVFYADGAIQMIVGVPRLDFADQLRASNVMPSFSFGSRSKPGDVDARAQGAGYPASGNRRDWLIWRADAEPGPQTEGGRTEGKAAPASTEVPPIKDDQFFQQQEQRLRLLQRLREQGLITDPEYQEKKKEILRGL